MTHVTERQVMLLALETAEIALWGWATLLLTPCFPGLPSLDSHSLSLLHLSQTDPHWRREKRTLAGLDCMGKKWLPHQDLFRKIWGRILVDPSLGQSL